MQALSLILGIIYCIILVLPIHGFYLSFPQSAHVSQLSRARSLDVSTEVIGTQIIDNAVLKVPSNAWRWPSSWPFQPVNFETTAVSPANISSVPRQIYMLHLRQYISNFDKNTVLFISDTSELPVSGNTGGNSHVYCSTNDLPNLLQSYPHEYFDNIVLLGAISSLSKPKEYFFSLWQLLKFSGHSHSHLILS
jgi:hypothetical protein